MKQDSHWLAVWNQIRTGVPQPPQLLQQAGSWILQSFLFASTGAPLAQVTLNITYQHLKKKNKATTCMEHVGTNPSVAEAGLTRESTMESVDRAWVMQLVHIEGCYIAVDAARWIVKSIFHPGCNHISAESILLHLANLWNSLVGKGHSVSIPGWLFVSWPRTLQIPTTEQIPGYYSKLEVQTAWVPGQDPGFPQRGWEPDAWGPDRESGRD